MNDIFVCYRRADSAEVTERICDRIRDRFLSATIFKDVDSIPPGVDFRTHIAEQIQKSKVFLAIIGRDWLTIASEDGKRRIDDPQDHLRIELETALKFNIPIIPVLVRRAVMPSANQLPSAVRDLAFRHAVEVRPDPDFVQDIEKLFKSIAEKIGRKRLGLRLSKILLAVICLALISGLIFIVGLYFYSPSGPTFTSYIPIAPDDDILESEAATTEKANVPTIIIPYNPKFLGDINIPLPMITDEAVISDLLNGRVFEYTHYSLVMDGRRAMPLYSASNIDRKKLFQGLQNKLFLNQGEPYEWIIDSRIDRDLQRGRGLYSSNDWKRGHLVRRMEIAWGDSQEEAEVASRTAFFYSNSIPQYSEFDQKVWLQLELYYTYKLHEEASRLTVFTGPISKPSDIEYRGNKIPQAFWKIIAVEDPRNNHNIFVYAYVIKQYEIYDKGTVLPYTPIKENYFNHKDFQVRVTDIENLVPLDFGTLRQFDMYGRE